MALIWVGSGGNLRANNRCRFNCSLIFTNVPWIPLHAERMREGKEEVNKLTNDIFSVSFGRNQMRFGIFFRIFHGKKRLNAEHTAPKTDTRGSEWLENYTLKYIAPAFTLVFSFFILFFIGFSYHALPFESFAVFVVVVLLFVILRVRHTKLGMMRMTNIEGKKPCVWPIKFRYAR